MAYESKYYNLDAHGPDWTKAGFAWAVEALETMSRERLLRVCALPEINIRFTATDWRENTQEEEIIGVILADYPSDTVLSAIRKIV